MDSLQLLRPLVMISAFAAVLIPLALVHYWKRDWLAAKTVRRYDVVIVVLVTFVAANVWLRRDASVTALFHRLYVDEWGWTTLRGSHWLGQPLLKTPLDLWVYQEIMHERRPTVILETGTWQGGSAKYFASMFDLLDEPEGRIITVDVDTLPRPQDPRITYLLGSSTSDEILSQIRSDIRPSDKVMVALDSDHSKEHVLNELRLYSDLVTVGQYLVVEDTHLHGNPILTGEGDPLAAVLEFLETDHRFEADRSREKFGLTFNPNGWLERVR